MQQQKIRSKQLSICWVKKIFLFIIPIFKIASLLLIFMIFFLIESQVQADTPVTQYRLLFAGDIMLAREVRHEIISKNNQTPWINISSFLAHADWVVGNLEGVIGDPKKCDGTERSPCFAMDPAMLRFVKNAGFNALGVENNHSADLGTMGKIETRNFLEKNNVAPLSYDDSPQFLRLGQNVLAIITLSNVPGRDGKEVEIPSDSLLQKLRLAKALANWVIVYCHWGVELRDWPQSLQRDQAIWLIKHGADVIIGHHPHVVQMPQCVMGKPVFFSLGNHVFDQKYPETKRGLIAECIIKNNKMQCDGVETITAPNSSFPALLSNHNGSLTVDNMNLNHCLVTANKPTIINGYTLYPKIADHQISSGKIVLEGKKIGEGDWITHAENLLALQPFHPNYGNKQEFIFMLERHHSSIDQEEGPRPYVYAVTPEGLVAKWRGSALAWPLIDGMIMPSNLGGDFLCALHRNDSFILLNPKAQGTRTAVYRWNGFGFSGIQDAKLEQQCKDIADYGSKNFITN